MSAGEGHSVRDLALTPARRDRRDVLIVVALALVICGALWAPQLRRLYPFVYDEHVYMVKVRAYGRWLREGLAQAWAGNPGWLFSESAVAEAERREDMHPGFAKYVAMAPNAAVRAIIGREGGARVTSGLFLALACGALYWFLAPRVGRWWAVVGALGLASLPRIFGHGHLLTLDVPIMAMYLVAALALRRAALLDRAGPAIAAGVLAGCALATKLNAVALAPHLLVWLLIVRPRGWPKTLAGCLIAPPLLFALWPWLWHDFPTKVARYVEFHAQHFYVGVSYFGTVHAGGGATTPPASYAPVMVALTTPLPWTLAALAGLVWVARRRLGEAGDFLALGLIVSVGLVMLPGAARYGGVRLILPAFPFLVGLGTLMAARLSDLLVRHGGDRRLTPALLAALLLAPGLIGCVRYYPFDLSYYAEPLGLRGAARLGMDVTYYGDAFAGAADFMARPEHLEDRYYASNELATAVLDALIIAGEIPRADRMMGRYVTDRLPPDADWIIMDHHPPMWPPPVVELMRTTTPVFTVSRDGVWLVAIYPGPRQSAAAARISRQEE